MDIDKELFWSLLEPEYGGAQMFCRKLVGNRELGDDLFQDALVAAFTKFASLREHSSFRPWLYRIMINTFRSSLRRPWWKRFVPMSPEAELRLVGDDPLDVLTARRWLDRAFKVLAPEATALVTLHELEGWPVSDLARLYGKTEGAIKASLFRARKKMKNAILRFGESQAADDREDNSLRKDSQCVAAKPELE